MTRSNHQSSGVPGLSSAPAGPLTYFRSLVEEIHRRGLWQAAIAFPGTSWALLQVLTIQGSVVHERLGVLHEATGDSAMALTHYAEFVRRWANADLDQQPRVERAKERILALGGRPPLA